MASRVFTYLATGTASDLTAISSNSARTKVMGWSIYNSGASAAYVNFYWGNAGFGGSVGAGFSSGKDSPTVGTDSPDLNIAIPAASNAFLVAPENGVLMQGSNLYMSITTTPATPGPSPVFTGSVAASAVLVNVMYEQ